MVVLNTVLSAAALARDQCRRIDWRHYNLKDFIRLTDWCQICASDACKRDVYIYINIDLLENSPVFLHGKSGIS